MAGRKLAAVHPSEVLEEEFSKPLGHIQHREQVGRRPAARPTDGNAL